MMQSSRTMALAVAAAAALSVSSGVSLAQDQQSSTPPGSSDETGGTGHSTQAQPQPDESGAYGGSSQAQPGQPGQSGMPSQQGQGQPVERQILDSRSRNFFYELAQTNLVEIQLAQLALQRTTDSRVKGFARDVLQHHQDETQQLQTLSSSLGVVLPTALDDRRRQQVQALESKSGRDFDEEFAEEMVQIHQDAVDSYQTMANASQVSPRLQRWATDEMPYLRQTATRARSLQQQLESQEQDGNQGQGGEGQGQGGGEGQGGQPNEGGMQPGGAGGMPGGQR